MTKSLLLAACTVIAFVSGRQTTQNDRFSRADVNKDARLSRNEVTTCLVSAVFENRDANKDNIVTSAEWGAESDAAEKKAFAARDANGDGFLTLSEAAAYSGNTGASRQLMTDADANKDGSLTREEVMAHYASKEGPIRKMGPPPSPASRPARSRAEIPRLEFGASWYFRSENARARAAFCSWGSHSPSEAGNGAAILKNFPKQVRPEGFSHAKAFSPAIYSTRASCVPPLTTCQSEFLKRPLSIRFGTKTRSFTSCMSKRSPTAMATALAISAA